MFTVFFNNKSFNYECCLFNNFVLFLHLSIAISLFTLFHVIFLYPIINMYQINWSGKFCCFTGNRDSFKGRKTTVRHSILKTYSFFILIKPHIQYIYKKKLYSFKSNTEFFKYQFFKNKINCSDF